MRAGWRTVVPVLVILAAEFLLRDVMIAPRDLVTDSYVRRSIAFEMALTAGLLFWVVRVEGEPLQSIGLGPFRRRHVWVGALGFVVAMFLSVAAGPLLTRIGLSGLPSLQPLLKRLDVSTRVMLFLVGTFCEEIFYRGYLIERVARWSGRRWIGAMASWLAFTTVHLGFFGLGPTLDVALLGGVLVIVYLRERSLWPCIVLHGLNGVIGYLLLPIIPPHGP